MMADAAHADPRHELSDRWTSGTVLKQDIFSTVERGRFALPQGEVDAVLRRIDCVPWWTKPIARHFLHREARALATAGELGVAPRLLHHGRAVLVRSWIDGVPLHLAKPLHDAAYFISAKRALRKLHRAGFSHNDLAKEQNWLRGADGHAYLTDFQLATAFRGRLSRLARYEDIRHLLKHKRRYAPEFLTATEKRVLARKSWPTRVWMATGKRIYIAITRGLFRFTDREGGGPRLVFDAPRLAAFMRTQEGVLDVVIVAFPDRRSGTGLYAFVEASNVSEGAARAHAAREPSGARPAERVQIVEALPRDAHGSVRIELLQLVAMNQVDRLEDMAADDAERALVRRLVAGRQNMRDRFAF